MPLGGRPAYKVPRHHGTDGNAFAVLGKVKQALKRAGGDPAETSEFFEEATAGDYDHLLQTVMRWVTVE